MGGGRVRESDAPICGNGVGVVGVGARRRRASSRGRWAWLSFLTIEQRGAGRSRGHGADDGHHQDCCRGGNGRAPAATRAHHERRGGRRGLERLMPVLFFSRARRWVCSFVSLQSIGVVVFGLLVSDERCFTRKRISLRSLRRRLRSKDGEREKKRRRRQGGGKKARSPADRQESAAGAHLFSLRASLPVMGSILSQPLT